MQYSVFPGMLLLDRTHSNEPEKTGRMKEEEFKKDKAKMPGWKERREEGGGGCRRGGEREICIILNTL